MAKKTFKYRNQEYESIKILPGEFICDKCEFVNAKYLKSNPTGCVALTRTGKPKFDCIKKCSRFCYPKRIK